MLDRRQLLSAGLAVLPLSATADVSKPVAFQSATAIPGGVRLSQGDLDIAITVSPSGIISVVKARQDYRGDRNGFFLGRFSPARMRLARSGKEFVLEGAGRKLTIDMAAGIIVVLDNAGQAILTDLGAQVWSQETPTPLSQGFTLATAGPLLGLGQFRDPVTDYRNRSVYLAHANMDAVLPLLISPPGFGLLWDTGTHAQFTSRDQSLTYDVPEGELIRYHVFLGQTPDEIIAAYRRLTGQTPLLGKWAYGYWQSQLGYWKQNQLTDIVDGYRARKLPLDVIIQDATYWGSGTKWFPNWSGMTWDGDDFPSPKGMCDHVHKENGHILASIWPTIGAQTALYRDLDAQGLLFKGETWSGGRVLDITAPKARDIYWRYIRKGMMDTGLDGLWTDANEPEFMTAATRYLTARTFAAQGTEAAGPIKDNLLTFSYYQTRLLYEEQVKAFPARRPITLTRKVYAGQQAFNTVLWSGDLTASWQTLFNQTINVQQMALAGLPYWTNDSGGFFVASRFPDALNDPAYKELYVRWFQFSAFLPVFRAHGYDIRRELWAFGGDGDPVYEALKAVLERRYALMPYIYAQAARVTFENESFVRPLVMDHGDDPAISGYPSQFVFGRDILVAPVTMPFEHTPQSPKDFVRNDAVEGDAGGVSLIEFYDGTNFDRLAGTLPSDNLAIGGFGDLPESIRSKPYSMRWKGRLIAPETGVFNVTVASQGITRIVLDGAVVMATAAVTPDNLSSFNLKDPTSTPPPPTLTHFDLNLQAGKAYEFEISQSQAIAGLVGFDFQWQTPSQRANQAIDPEKRMQVYLPKGAGWYAYGTPQRLAGGQVLSVRPALGDMPLYVRAGAILPLTPGIQYASQPVNTLQLHIYSGADGQLELYSDAGDGQGYLRGEKSRRRLSWNEAARRLTISSERGRYPGQPAQITFVISLFDGVRQQVVSKTITLTPAQSRRISL